MVEWTAASFVGGHVVLDFCNTVSGASVRERTDRLTDWDTVADWGLRVRLITVAEAAALSGSAEAVEADRALDDLRRMREALYETLRPGEGDRPASAALNQILHDGLARGSLVAGTGGIDWCVAIADAGHRLLQARLAAEIVAFTRSEARHRVRQCGRCSWLFLGRGRGRGRRWCSMATCGNREKARRHRSRTPPKG